MFVGCATQLYGDLDKADLIKIHLQSKKVSLMMYDDFAGTPVPVLQERIKINLIDQKIDFFDYTRHERKQLLYNKSRYLHPAFPGYDAQKAFDKEIEALGLFDFSSFGPPSEVFFSTLQERGISIGDHSDY